MPYKNPQDRKLWHLAKLHGETFSNGNYKHGKGPPKTRPDCDYREPMIALIRAAKAVPCTDCGVSYPYYVMDLDHTRGERIFWLSDVTRRWRDFTYAMVVEELTKCDVVCSNCHRLRTHQRGYGTHSQEEPLVEIFPTE
jgi:hypothetical protein